MNHNSSISLTRMLSLLNPHERDARISFEPVEHKYTIDADPSKPYTSVTTWVHSHFSEFDTDGIIKRMMASRNWKQSPYYGMTADAIKAAWDANRDAAAAAGTAMHYNIECHYNGLPIPPDDTEALEFRYFLQFYADHAPHLRPYRTEWTVFDEAARISGSIDMVFENLDPHTGEPDGTLSIYDWKRCKEIKKVPFGAKDYSHTPLIAHIPDTNYWHYCLQLNAYKAILERNYGKRVTDLFLVCLHPDNKNGSYQCIRVVDLQSDIAVLFKERLDAFSPCHKCNNLNKCPTQFKTRTTRTQSRTTRTRTTRTQHRPQSRTRTQIRKDKGQKSQSGKGIKGKSKSR
jgi:hypothetical protein